MPPIAVRETRSLRSWRVVSPTAPPDEHTPSRGGTVARNPSRRKEMHMETLVLVHEVDDVDHWLASPTREEYFGPLGITARTFRDPSGSNRVALIVETPDIATWEAALEGDAAAQAMKTDGVRPETIAAFVEA
jgi:hypothetical protein